MDPKVSVILPNFNHARFLQKRVDSILNQTYTDFELIVLDDCSTDNSKEIIELYKSHPKVSQVVYNAENSGTTFKQWQKGLALAKGELIWIAESDDYCDRSFLQTAVSRISADPAINLFFTRSYQVDEKDVITSNTLEWSTDRPLYKWDDNFDEDGEVFIINCMVQSNIIVNASGVLFKKIAVNDTIFPTITSLRKMGDWLFWVSCLSDGKVAYHGVKPLNYFRDHRQSTRYLPDLQAVVLQKVEKYFVLNNIQKMIPDVNFSIWIQKSYVEMIRMTPVNGFKVLHQTLKKITSRSILLSTFLLSKIYYTLKDK